MKGYRDFCYYCVGEQKRGFGVIVVVMTREALCESSGILESNKSDTNNKDVNRRQRKYQDQTKG